MIKVSMPIIVEGKYDRIKLAQFIDGVIIETSGFKVFKNKELIDSLRNLSLTKGIIVLTDSDSSGFKIRNFLKSVLPQNAKITDVYIPQIKGKEKRKISSSSEGLLGVEGLDEDTIISCFDRAKITSSFKKNLRDGKGFLISKNYSTKQELYVSQKDLEYFNVQRRKTY